MNKKILYTGLIMTVLLFAGCKEDIPSEGDLTDDTSGKRVISLTAAMPGDDDPQARVALNQDGKDIALTWEETDQIQLLFVQDGNVYHNEDDHVVTVKDISEGGKSAAFDIIVPAGITGGTFDLYGVYGGGGLDGATPNLATLPNTTGSAKSLDEEEVMLYFVAEVEYAAPSTSVTFQHLGSLFSIRLTNNGASSINGLKEARLVGPAEGTWAYNNSGSYDLVGKAFTDTSTGNFLTFASPQESVAVGETIEFWAWYPPLSGEAWPELTLELVDTGGTTLFTSIDTKAGRTAVAGKAYYFYAGIFSEGLQFTDNSGTPGTLQPLVGIQPLALEGIDYQAAWEGVSADFLAPSVSPTNKIPLLLNDKVSAPAEGDYQVVSYNYSSTEPTIASNQEITVFEDDVQHTGSWAVINQPTWFNKIVTGRGRQWSGISLNSSIVAMSYIRGADITESDSWLVTNEPLDMLYGENFEISLDYGWGYTREGTTVERLFTLSILVSEEFDGIDPRNSTWVDITDVFFTLNSSDEEPAKLDEIETTPPSYGYPGTRPYTTENANQFEGKNFYLAFRDNRPSKPEGYAVGNMFIWDNLKVKKTQDVATANSAIEPVYALFKYSAGNWVIDEESYILQPSDYTAIGQTHLTPENAATHIPGILANHFTGTEGQIKTVVYFTADNKTNAELYKFSGSTWTRL